MALLRRIEAWPLLAMTALGGGLWLVLKLAAEVKEGETGAFDRAVLLALRTPGDAHNPIGPQWVQESARDMTALGGFTVLTLVTIAAVAVLLIYRRRAQALVFGATVLLAQGAAELIKSFVARPRPDLVSHLDLVYSSSFPSGHSVMSPAALRRLFHREHYRARDSVRWPADNRLRQVEAAPADSGTLPESRHSGADADEQFHHCRLQHRRLSHVVVIMRFQRGRETAPAGVTSHHLHDVRHSVLGRRSRRSSSFRSNFNRIRSNGRLTAICADQEHWGIMIWSTPDFHPSLPRRRSAAKPSNLDGGAAVRTLRTSPCLHASDIRAGYRAGENGPCTTLEPPQSSWR